MQHGDVMREVRLEDETFIGLCCGMLYNETGPAHSHA